jgi:hypothetical protein
MATWAGLRRPSPTDDSSRRLGVSLPVGRGPIPDKRTPDRTAQVRERGCSHGAGSRQALSIAPRVATPD